MNMDRRASLRKRKKRERGFTLLLAALIASIVLSLAASIFEIAQKEVALSSMGRDSQFAFYAADAAAECALYWDSRFGYFATSTPVGVTPTCDWQPLNVTGQPPSGCSGSTCYPYTTLSQQIDLFKKESPAGDYCAQVSVVKSLDPTTHAVRSVIHADGYSVGCAALASSPDALQRSVELQY
jgi:hypothetical protein